MVLDWTVALFFRRDIAELGMLGHPRGSSVRNASPTRNLLTPHD